MIEVIVFVSGLVLGTPDAGPDPNGITFLLARGHGNGADQIPVPPHKARIAVGGIAYELLDPAWVRIEHRPAQGPVGTLTLNESQQFANLSALLPQGTKVRSECLGATALQDCQVDGKAILSAIVRLEGAWSLRAHSRCPVDPMSGASRIMEGLTDATTFRYVKASSVGSPGPVTGATLRLADSYGFRVTVQDLSEVRLSVGTNQLPIQEEADSAECGRFGAARCSLVDITSMMATGHPMKAATAYDPHLPALYDLLDPAPAASERLVPVEAVSANCVGIPGDTNPPYSKCKVGAFWVP